jgi:hypothetical protein
MNAPFVSVGSRWLVVVVVAAAALAGGCLQEVNSGASRGFDAAANGAGELTTNIVPSTNPIALDPMDETSTTMDACEKTRRDKTEVLTAFCASCHAGSAAVGLPPWNFVLDDNQLINEVWTREGQPPQRFVIPGDPDHSALYQRMAIAGDMPPQPTDLGTHRNPTPSAADVSIVREWILHCLGAPAPAATGGTSGTGGVPAPGTGGTTATPGSGGVPGSGTGGSKGTGGRTGAAGSGGAPGSGGESGGAAGAAGAGSGGRAGTGGTSARDGGVTDVGSASGGTSGGMTDGGGASDGGSLPTCGTGVTNGHSCVAHTPDCQAGSKTCMCELSSGKHSWSCR